ncbi:MAG: MFS transporter [Planctomycetes bacterium]|nr:MFS transporter [Planctomycetota bacterium]
MSDKPLDPTSEAAAVHHQHRAFGRSYWMLNCIEMFERLAYFGIRAVVPLYIMQATEPGGLHLSALHKGWIYMWWAVFQSFLPIVTGGFADRYGYKRVLFFAISANVVGYVMMANMHTYLGFFAGILVLATGTAFFKPALQGSLAQNLTKENSSLGWGVFYWVVNVGAVSAPFVSTAILGKPHSLAGWQTLFYACACFTACNLLLLLTFKDVPSGADKTESTLAVLKRTIVNIFEVRLIIWLLIMSCFWLMMYQLWDLHPNFITDWVDSSRIAAYVPFDAWWEWGDRGKIQVPQQLLLNLNAALIIVLMVPMSWVSGKMRTLSAMMVGMTVATLGVLVAGWTMSGGIFLAGVVFFSLGEMWTGPKKNEYLGLIAPPGKKGLYLGYVNIPVGIGVGIGSYFGGWLYDNYGEKATLALKELATRPALVARAAQSADWSDALDKLPELLDIERQEAFDIARIELGLDESEAANRLRELFRNDRGQLTNLGYRYLAFCPEFRDAVRAGLGEELRHQADDRDFDAAQLEPDASDTREPRLAEANKLRRQAAQVDAGHVLLEDDVLSRHGHNIPKWVDKKRMEVLDIVREHINKDRPDDEKKDDEIAAMLWTRFGDEPAVVNNLALEYLAQGTNRLHDAVSKLEYEHEPAELEARIKEIEEGIGIGRTKSFSALTAAMGVDDAVLQQALTERGAKDVYCYLAGLAHRRFLAVAPRDWSKDVALLREMIESDADAKAYVEAHVWKKGLWERISLIFGDEQKQDIYERLAENQDLIRHALDKKNWSNASEQAARLFRLNPFEARALAAAEVNSAAQTATQMLWNKYNPNRNVWLPIVAVGVVATIALGIFGQMAKRWNDMNA